MALSQQAWLYARRSQKQDTHASVTDQKDRGRAVCDENGWTLAGIIDEEVSASRYARKIREGWTELLGTLRAGKIDILILWESSRGDRRAGDWMNFLDECMERGVKIHVISHDRTYDPANHRDWKTLASEGVDNDHFSRRLSVEIRRGKAGAMRRGRPSGQTPYGYEVHYNPQTRATAGWKIIPEEAEIVRTIIHDVGEHRPLRKIALELNERGIPSPTGGTWLPRVVRHIAGNCAYAGLVHLPDGSYAERQEQEDGAEWPPIVSRAEWEKSSAVLNARATGPRPGGVKHLMTCMARCECGQWLKLGHKGYYQCASGDMYVQEKWLDGIIRYLVCERLGRDDARDLFVAEDDGRTAKLRADVKALRGRRDKFRKMAAAGTIEPDALGDIEAELNPKIKAAERELGEVRYVPALADILAADDTFAAWDRMTIAARREVIAAVSGVTVKKAGKHASAVKRLDARRVVFDWKPQPPRLKPGGRAG